jgi:hypothetical protein
MKRMFAAALVVCMLLLGPATGALAGRDNPVSDAARVSQTCPNSHGDSGRSTHGSWVSGVALNLYPIVPIDPA